LINKGILYYSKSAPVVRRPAYIVYRTQPADAEIQSIALEGLRSIAARESFK
jgi:hypothetical protein